MDGRWEGLGVCLDVERGIGAFVWPCFTGSWRACELYGCTGHYMRVHVLRTRADVMVRSTGSAIGKQMPTDDMNSGCHCDGITELQQEKYN
jgi:hypothetical protein